MWPHHFPMSPSHFTLILCMQGQKSWGVLDEHQWSWNVIQNLPHQQGLHAWCVSEIRSSLSFHSRFCRSSYALLILRNQQSMQKPHLILREIILLPLIHHRLYRIGYQNLKQRIILMSWVCPLSLSFESLKGIVHSNEPSEVWLKMKHSHSIHNRNVEGGAPELLRRQFTFSLISW